MAFKRVKNLSAWRKIALNNWNSPGDPSVYGSYDFDVTETLEALDKINQRSPIKLTLTHVFTKALANTIQAYPVINRIIKWGTLYQRDTVDIFLQVAIPNSAMNQKEMLSGYKISCVNEKSIFAMAQELKSASEQIRDPLKPDPQYQKQFSIAKTLPVFMLKWLIRLQEFLTINLNFHFPKLGLIGDPFGSAMITSVGSLGIPAGLAPLVPLGRCPFLVCLGLVEDKPKVMQDKIVIRKIASVTVTFDHRFIDGLLGSKMYRHFKEQIEGQLSWIDDEQNSTSQNV